MNTILKASEAVQIAEKIPPLLSFDEICEKLDLSIKKLSKNKVRICYLDLNIISYSDFIRLKIYLGQLGYNFNPNSTVPKKIWDITW